MNAPIFVEGSRYSFTGASDPEPDLDSKTNTQKLNASGQPMNKMQLLARANNRSEIWPIKFPGKTTWIGVGVPLKVSGLTARPWTITKENGVSSGVTFTAEKIEPEVTAR